MTRVFIYDVNGIKMFVRDRKVKSSTGKYIEYTYIVENKWNPVLKKYQQKTIASLGRKDQLVDKAVFDKIILALKAFEKRKGQRLINKAYVVDSLSNEGFCSLSKDYGVYWLTEKLIGKLSFDKIIKETALKDKDKKVSFKNILASLTALLAHRLTRSQDKLSELATFKWFTKDLFFPQKPKLDLNYLYRTLDFLLSNKDKIEKEYYEENRNLFNQELDLVLFDTTTVYYWGEKGEAGIKHKDKDKYDEALLRYGRPSKDKRSDLKQLIVGVLMTEEGMPIAHETFPGNQLDVISFPEIIKKVKKKYSIGKVIFIADKGMISEENLRTLEHQGLEYILGVKLRKLPLPLRKTLVDNMDKDKMKEVRPDLYSAEFKMSRFLQKGSLWPYPTKDKPKRMVLGKRIIDELARKIYQRLDFYQSRTASKEKDLKDIKERILKRRYFICFNPFVAKDKQEKREFFKKIIKDKIKYKKNKDWIVKNGYKKYLKFNKLEPKLDKEKLKAEKHYDGKWILLTNSQIVSPALATRRYKTLRLIEQGFKDLKSQINIRPIFHSKEERIKAHVFVAFLALVIRRYLCRQLNPTSQTTGRRFIKKLNDIKAVEVDKKDQVWVRTEIGRKTLNHLKILKITPPQKLLLDRRKYIKPKREKQTKTKQKTNRYGGRNLTLPLF